MSTMLCECGKFRESGYCDHVPPKGYVSAKEYEDDMRAMLREEMRGRPVDPTAHSNRYDTGQV